MTSTPPAPYGDYQFEIYLPGLAGVVPTPADVLRRAGSPGRPRTAAVGVVLRRRRRRDERTQRANVTAFRQWGLIPRMLVGATERDLSVELFGRTLARPAVHGAHRRDRAVRAGPPRRPRHRAGRRADRRADVRLDADQWIRWRTSPRSSATPQGFFQLYTPDRPRSGRELRAPRRGRRIRGHRRHPGHLGHRLATARPGHQQFPAAARASAWPTTSATRSSAPRLATPPATPTRATSVMHWVQRVRKRR